MRSDLPRKEVDLSRYCAQEGRKCFWEYGLLDKICVSCVHTDKYLEGGALETSALGTPLTLRNGTCPNVFWDAFVWLDITCRVLPIGRLDPFPEPHYVISIVLV